MDLAVAALHGRVLAVLVVARSTGSPQPQPAGDGAARIATRQPFPCRIGPTAMPLATFYLASSNQAAEHILQVGLDRADLGQGPRMYSSAWRSLRCPSTAPNRSTYQARPKERGRNTRVEPGLAGRVLRREGPRAVGSHCGTKGGPYLPQCEPRSTDQHTNDRPEVDANNVWYLARHPRRRARRPWPRDPQSPPRGVSGAVVTRAIGRRAPKISGQPFNSAISCAHHLRNSGASGTRNSPATRR
jgi:hypothetical protein